MTPRTALAAPEIVVAAVYAPDERGKWRRIDDTGDATVARGEEELPVQSGMLLEIGDRIRTDLVRVELSMDGNEQLIVAEGSDFTLRDRGVLQALGEVYYRVRGAFSVDYATVETTVEGTAFLISGGPDDVQVGVEEGRVRVTSGGQSVSVRRNQQVAVVPDQAPPEPTRWGRTKRRGDTNFAWPSLGGRGAVGGMFGADRRGGATLGHAQLFGRIDVAFGLRLTFDAGVAGLAKGEGLQVPVGTGLEFAIGDLAVGAQLSPSLQIVQDPCGGVGTVHLGGAGTLRYTVPLTGPLLLETMVRGGYADGPTVDGGVGLGVAL